MKLYSTATFRCLCLWQHQSQQAIVALCPLPQRRGVAAVASNGRVETIVYSPQSRNPFVGRPLERRRLNVLARAAAPLCCPPHLLVVGECDNSVSLWRHSEVESDNTCVTPQADSSSGHPAREDAD